MTAGDALDFVHEEAPRRVLFGAGRRAQVPDELDRLGAARVLVVAGRHEAGAADALAASLGPRLAGRVSGVRQHVPRPDAEAAVELARRHGVDAVVTIGGGSATGLGKAVALGHDARLVAVPTTYAGSEMTSIWGVSGAGEKRTGRAERVRPAVVVYDPELTLTLPLPVTAASAMNALAHAVAAIGGPRPDPVREEAALAAVTVLRSALPGVVLAPDDLPARTALLYGAFRAGAAMAGAPPGVQHRTAHVLGGRFGLDHAGVHAALLAPVTAWREAAEPHLGRRLAGALGAAPAAPALLDLARRSGAPTSLAALGLPHDALAGAATAVADDLRAAATEGAVPDEAEVGAILEDAWRGAPAGR